MYETFCLGTNLPTNLLDAVITLTRIRISTAPPFFLFLAGQRNGLLPVIDEGISVAMDSFHLSL